MRIIDDRPSARIYAFPVRPRPSIPLGAARIEAGTGRSASSGMPGSGWYHDEAIREAERNRRG